MFAGCWASMKMRRTAVAGDVKKFARASSEPDRFVGIDGQVVSSRPVVTLSGS